MLALLGQLSRFGVVGALSNVVYFGVLGLLSGLLGARLWLGSGVAYAVSMCVNYLLQRRITFRSDRRHREAGIRYVVVHLVALGLNSSLLEIFVTRLGWPFLLGQGLALAVTISWSYTGQRFWVFKVGAPKSDGDA